jgi:hypothetical protein
MWIATPELRFVVKDFGLATDNGIQFLKASFQQRFFISLTTFHRNHKRAKEIAVTSVPRTATGNGNGFRMKGKATFATRRVGVRVSALWRSIVGPHNAGMASRPHVTAPQYKTSISETPLTAMLDG